MRFRSGPLSVMRFAGHNVGHKPRRIALARLLSSASEAKHLVLEYIGEEQGLLFEKNPISVFVQSSAALSWPS